MNLAPLDTLARQQHGLVTHRQAVHLLGRGRVDGLVGKGVLMRVRRGVYRTVGAPPDWLQELAGVLLQRPGAVASHACAAALWEMAPAWPSPAPEVTVPITSLNRLSGASVHRANLTSSEITTTQGLAVTTPARTIVDLGAVATKERIEIALDDVLRRRLTSLQEVSRSLDANRRPGPPRL